MGRDNALAWRRIRVLEGGRPVRHPNRGSRILSGKNITFSRIDIVILISMPTTHPKEAGHGKAAEKE
jgi:hypothetical protein